MTLMFWLEVATILVALVFLRWTSKRDHVDVKYSTGLFKVVLPALLVWDVMTIFTAHYTLLTVVINYVFAVFLFGLSVYGIGLDNLGNKGMLKEPDEND